MNSQWRPFNILPFWLNLLLFKLPADAFEPRARTISLRPGTSWAMLLHSAPSCSPYRLACWWCPSLGCTQWPSPPGWERAPESWNWKPKIASSLLSPPAVADEFNKITKVGPTRMRNFWPTAQVESFLVPRAQRSAKSQCRPSSREAVKVTQKSAIRRREKLMLGWGVVGHCTAGSGIPGQILGSKIGSLQGLKRDSTGFMSDGSDGRWQGKFYQMNCRQTRVLQCNCTAVKVLVLRVLWWFFSKIYRFGLKVKY